MLYSLSRIVLLFLLAFSPWLTRGAQAQPSAAQFVQWLTYYSQNDIRADYNYDGVLSPADFSAFLLNYDTPPDNPPQPTTGWTELNPTPGVSLVIFVSSSQGNDNNDGRSSVRPVKTIARAYELVRDGKPDWVRLRRGDIFLESLPNWKKSGLSKAQPMVVTSYGDSGARPRILTGNGRAMRATGPEVRRHLAFVGLEMRPHTRTRNDAPGGIEFICEHRDILIEDCLIAGYADNLNFSGDSSKRASDVRVRRNVIVDSWAVGRHSQGMYTSRVDGVLIEENIFDRNGWNPSISGAEATIFNHNIYVQTNCSNINVTGNIIANASSHGLQARPGGNVTGNLFYRNSINILLGNEEYQTTGTIASNVILEGKDISPSLPRGMGIHVQNSLGAKIRENVILRNATSSSHSEAIAIIGNSNKVVRDLLIENNTIFNWLNNFVVENEGVRNATFRYNTVYDSVNQSPAVRHFSDSTLDDVIAYQNVYFIGGTSNWFRVRHYYYSLSQWQNIASESNSSGIGSRRFVDSTRTLDRYAQNLLLPANGQTVIDRARLKDKTTWDENYTAAKIVSYFKEGYRLAD